MRIAINKNAETQRKFANLSRFAFFCNFPNFVLTLIEAFSANSVVVWIDTLVTLGETLHSLIVWIVALKLCKDCSDKYNFGMGRLEVFVSLVCDLLICVGMFGMLTGSVWNIVYPQAPDASILYFIFMKCSCTSFDIYLYAKQVKICRSNPSKLNVTEKIAYRISLINDATMGVIAVVCYFFRTYDFVAYFSPIASVILALYFIVGYIKRIRVSIAEVSDVSLPLPKQDEIFDILLENRDRIKRIISANTRRLNGKSYIEIAVVMQDEVTYRETAEYLDCVRDKIKAIEPDSEVTLVIGASEE